jgi:hypothetical protein
MATRSYNVVLLDAYRRGPRGSEVFSPKGCVRDGADILSGAQPEEACNPSTIPVQKSGAK